MGEGAQDITGMLRRWSDGDRDSLETLMPLVYAELRRQAAGHLRRERPDHTLQATALINEAYLKLIDQRHVEWQNRAHFFAIASQAMRRILVDHARTKKREKRGGDSFDIALDDLPQAAASEPRSVDLVVLDEALDRLAAIDPQRARVVELKYFSGLSVAETAAVLNISVQKVERAWTIAKAWLHRELR